MEHFEKYASVITDLAIDKTLDYGIPPSFVEKIKKGVQVKVQLRGSLRNGIVFGIKESSSFPKVFPISEVLSEGEILPDDLFELALWMGKYYATPLFKILKVMIPSAIRKNISHKEQFFVMRAKTKEVLRQKVVSLRESHPEQASVLDIMLSVKKGILLTELLEKAQVSRSPVDSLTKKGLIMIEAMKLDRSPLIGEEYFKTDPKKLNQEQKDSLDKIVVSIEKNTFENHLLFGVTGSGKTEVYLQAIQRALDLGKGTIMLVPEISLTAQTIERFRSRFDTKLAILHHRLSQGERHDEWHRIRKNEAQIVIGARSAIFSPVQNLGLIIVDEEHDNAYKQSEEPPCYHARDVAVMRAKINHATTVLGSATPSIESFHNSTNGKYFLSTLKGRVDVAKMPQVNIVDMKKEHEKNKGFALFSQELIEGIKNRLSLGEQTIIFLNRRGFHTSFQCLLCGHSFKCPRCEISLTYHQAENTLSCHLCAFCQKPPPRHCPSCKRSEALKYKGIGTELVEKALLSLFKDARTIRIDGDTTRHKGSHEVLFRNFSTGKADILIGTQMISKGLHFPAVTLVAILNCDQSLQIPDFRASEHSFQLITQVAGRSGRGHLKGEVIIQTHMPENSTILLASKNSYEEFYEQELAIRKMFHYPPFTHFVKFLFVGPNSHEVQEYGQKWRKKISTILGSSFVAHPLLPAGHPKINEMYRFQFLIRGKGVYPVCTAYSQILADLTPNRNIRMMVDIDPMFTFF